MSYLVDGNNVMAGRVGWHRDKKRARRDLLDDVSAFALTKRLTVRVVFDGAPDSSFPDGARYKGITVFYARVGSNADERIKEFVEADGQRRTLIVVTSDRALADYVQQCGAQVKRSGEFRQMLEVPAPAPLEVEDEIHEPSEGWMRFFGASPEDDE